ncbi:MAG: hypothetical protein AAF193_01680, partial [Bacteroidota bacterium]
MALLIAFLMIMSRSLTQVVIEVDVADDVPSCGSATHVYQMTNEGAPIDDASIQLTLPEGLSTSDVQVSAGIWNGNGIQLAQWSSFQTLTIQLEIESGCNEALPVFNSFNVSGSNLIEPVILNVNYNTLAPSLNIVSFSNQSVQVSPGEPYFREITLRNAGNQSLSTCYVTIENDGSIELLSSNLGEFNSNLLILDADDFTDGSFDPEEDVILTIEEQLVECGSHAINYESWWSCTGSEVCQSAQASSTVSHNPGEPNVVLDAVDALDPNYCEVAGSNEFTITNNAAESEVGSAKASNLKVSFGLGWPNGDIGNSKYSGEYFVADSVQIDNTWYVLEEAIFDPEISNSRRIYQVILDELFSGESWLVDLRWHFEIPRSENPDCSEFEEVTYHGTMNMQVDYQNACGVQKPAEFIQGSGGYFQYRELTEDFLSPTDADDGDTFVLGLNKEMRIEGPVCDDLEYVLVMYPPDGITMVPNSDFGYRLSLSRNTTAQVFPDNHVEIVMDLPPSNSIAPYGEMELGAEFQLTCPVNLDEGIPYEVFLRCAECPDHEYTSKLACDVSFKLNAFCGTCTGLQLSSFPTIQRKTLGYSDSTQTTLIDESIAIANETHNKCLTHDLFQLDVEAQLVGMNGVENASLEITQSA